MKRNVKGIIRNITANVNSWKESGGKIDERERERERVRES